MEILVISLKYAAIFVPLNMIIALFLAMLITQPVRGVKVFRTIYYIPTVISGVAVSIIWGWILNGDYGVLNYLLSLIGIKGPKWLVDPAWALVAVVIASAFGVGSMMLIFYKDIKNIPIDVYEAANLDGASPARQFFSIYTADYYTNYFIQPDYIHYQFFPTGNSGNAFDRWWSVKIYIFLRTYDIQQCVQAPQTWICQCECMGNVYYHSYSYCISI